MSENTEIINETVEKVYLDQIYIEYPDGRIVLAEIANTAWDIK